MHKASYTCHRLPPVVIQHAIWVDYKFSLCYREVKDFLAEREMEVSYETVRRWVLKFGLVYARRLRKSRPTPRFWR
jgi:putative transposase